MSEFTAKVVEFTPSFIMKAKSGKNMEMWKFEYEVGGASKHFQGFASQLKTDKVLAKQLSQFTPGDYVKIETEKNAAGYDNIKSIQPAGSKPEVVGAPANHAKPGPQASRDFESKEERTARQRLIVRQSSLANAIALLPKAKPEEIMNVAEGFCDWVFEEERELPFHREPTLKDDHLDDDIPL